MARKPELKELRNQRIRDRFAELERKGFKKNVCLKILSGEFFLAGSTIENIVYGRQ